MPAPPRYVASSSALTEARWRRSSRSTGMNNCVETAPISSDRLAVRDSKNSAGPALLFPATSWTSFVTLVRDDGFDRAG